MTDLVHPSAAQRHAQSHLNGYRPDVDGLRALAVLSVLVFHAFPTLLPGGFIGVDVFFVISGFVLPLSLFNSGYRLPDAGRYLLKRFTRLFPPALASMCI